MEAVKEISISQNLGVHVITLQSWISMYMKTDSEKIEEEIYKFANSNHFAIKAKPFIKWVGGKSKFLKEYQIYYPPKSFNPLKNTYYEPFVGGGAIFFSLQPRHAVLSDTNEELITTYKVIKRKVKELIQSLKKYKNTKSYFLKVRATDPKTLTDVEVASRFIYLNRACFKGVYRVNTKGGFNVPYGYNKNPKICDEENLKNVSKVLKHVKLRSSSYEKVIEKAKKGDFIYFDPPYYPASKTSNFTHYTKNRFNEKEQINLFNLFKGLDQRGCFVMLSNSDTEFVRNLYKGFNIKRVHTRRIINSKMAGRGEVSELVIRNYK